MAKQIHRQHPSRVLAWRLILKYARGGAVDCLSADRHPQMSSRMPTFES